MPAATIIGAVIDEKEPRPSKSSVWGAQLRGLIRVGLVFFVVDVFVRWLFGHHHRGSSSGDISAGGSAAPMSPAALSRKIITPSAADRINRERTDEQRSSFEMVLGLQEYMPGGASYVPKVFPTHDEEGNPYGSMHSCVLPSHTIFDLLVYLTPFKTFDLRRDRRQLVWTVPGVAFNWTYKDAPTTEFNVTATASLRRNGSLYAHTFFVRPPAPIDQVDPAYEPLAVVYRRFSLVHYKPRKKRQVLRKLLETGDGPSSPSPPPGADIDANTDTDAVAVAVAVAPANATATATDGEAPPIGAAEAAAAHTGDSTGPGSGSGTASGGALEAAGAGAGAGAGAEAEGDAEPFVGHWCPTLALSLVLDMPPFARNQVSPTSLSPPPRLSLTFTLAPPFARNQVSPTPHATVSLPTAPSPRHLPLPDPALDGQGAPLARLETVPSTPPPAHIQARQPTPPRPGMIRCVNWPAWKCVF